MLEDERELIVLCISCGRVWMPTSAIDFLSSSIEFEYEDIFKTRCTDDRSNET